MTQQIIIGCPGRWNDHEEIIRSIALANKSKETAEYLALGEIFFNAKTKEASEFDVYEHDPRLAEAFKAESQGRFSEDDLAAIADHTYTVYLVQHEPSVAAAREIVQAGNFLLRAGGMAIKVETSGVAHQADRWRYYASTGSILPPRCRSVSIARGRPSTDTSSTFVAPSSTETTCSRRCWRTAASRLISGCTW